MGKVFKGSTPKTAPIAQNAPGSIATAAIDNASESARASMREKMRSAKGRASTNITEGQAVDQLKKALLGE